ncbi:MAG: 4'-phosphopantetheinyl transferase family protein [Granulosicoccaceae bacterium]
MDKSTSRPSRSALVSRRAVAAKRQSKVSQWRVDPALAAPANLPSLAPCLNCQQFKLGQGTTIWAIQPHASPARLLALVRSGEILNNEELRELQSMHSTSAASDKGLARWLLRGALSAAYPGTAPETWQFTRSTLGRPQLLSPKDSAKHLSFSVSHTQGLIVCAIHTNPTNTPAQIGVDVEPIARDCSIEKLSKKFLNTAEQRLLKTEQPADQLNAFMRFWTLKEAWSKALGLGLQADFHSAEFFQREGRIRLRLKKSGGMSRPESQPQWEFSQCRLFDRYWLALAITPSEHK